MRKNRLFLTWVLVLGLVALPVSVVGADESDLVKMTCTSFAAGRLATVDGSTMSGHTCDGNCDFTIWVVPRMPHQPGDKVHLDYTGLPGGFSHVVWGETQIPPSPLGG